MSSKGQEGVERKGNEQPHAKQIAHAFEPTMWGKDQERQPFPCRSPAMAMTSSLSALAAPLKGAAFAALTREGMRFEQLADEAFKDVL